VQKYERGVNRVSASRLFDLSCALKVPPAFFFDDMPETLTLFTPALVAQGSLPQTAQTREGDLLSCRETLELVRAYYGIGDPKVRDKIYAMVKALAKDGSDEQPGHAS
jgi:transcriptional regulator with XRE-family HTH domain